MLLLLRKHGSVQTYVGQTKRPRERLLQHRTQPPTCVARALQSDSATTDDLLYMPLEVVPIEHADDFELRWTLRANLPGKRSLNAFGTRGNPARTRAFWQRRHARALHAQQVPKNNSAESDTDANVIDLT
jgi:hypothetical protein